MSDNYKTNPVAHQKSKSGGVCEYMVYYAVMNTIAATWSGGLRERIGELGLRIERLGRRMSAWAAAKKRQKAEKAEADLPVIQLSDEAAERLERSADEAERGIGMSPVFDTAEEFIAYLKSDKDSRA